MTRVRSSRAVTVLFRVAAGPRLGFGHLSRAGVLARALGVRTALSLRGRAAARCEARRPRWTMAPSGPPAAVLRAVAPRALVVDDPSATAARRWCAAARRLGVPSISIHDLGLGFCGADLAIDGSIVRSGGPTEGRLLAGLRYAILNHPSRPVGRARHSRGNTVLIALGGGPRATIASRLADAICRTDPRLRVRVAAGMAGGCLAARPRVTWLGPRRSLTRELARCSVAVVGGGLTLYEAAALRTRVVAWPVVAAQQPTVTAFERRGAAVAVLPGPARYRRAAAAVAAQRRGELPAPPFLLDRRGAARVAAAIRHVLSPRRERVR